MDEMKNSERKKSVLIGLVTLLVIVVIVQALYLIKVKNETSSMKQNLETRRAVRGYFTPTSWDEDFLNAEWNPFEEMERMQQRMNRMFHESIRRAGAMPAMGAHDFGSDFAFEPAADVEDKGDHYAVKLDIPGMEKDKIGINVTENILTVSGERRIEKKQTPQKGVYHMERSYGSFYRQIPLPGPVKPEGVKAAYEQGVLTVELPKDAEVPETEKGKKVTVT